MDKQKQIIISHPHGNANTRGAVYGIARKGMLFRYVTSVAVFSNGFWHGVAKLPGLGMFMRKKYDERIKGKTLCYPIKELGRQICVKLKIKSLIKHEVSVFCTDKEAEYIDKKTAHILNRVGEKVDAVYCYEDVAFHTFREAKKQGKICIYDLPIGHWRAMRELLDKERLNNPEWAMTLGGFNDSDEKLARKDEEILLADKIYVASSFTKWSLKDYPKDLDNVEVIPYGFPAVNNQRIYQPLENRKIKALYVGGLSQRKGISYIFEAINGLADNIEMTIVGGGDIDRCPVLCEALKHVHYIPTLPHDEVLKLMAASDVFIFPSLFEGFGLVITESMSQGTPVITTDRTCGPDIITNGKDGWIVEAGTARPI
ncbi:MAG: glycosyltransferase family 4 protein, partial [Prevotella sp.]